jgi:hypothetical protein
VIKRNRLVMGQAERREGRNQNAAGFESLVKRNGIVVDLRKQQRGASFGFILKLVSVLEYAAPLSHGVGV